MLNKKFAVLFPSVISLSVSIFFSLILFIITALTRGGDNFLGRLLFGENASTSLVASSLEDIQSGADQIFGNQVLGRFTVFSTWLVIGLIVYAVLSSIMTALSKLKDFDQEVHQVKTQTARSSIVRAEISRALFRCFVACVWAGYTFVFLKYLVAYVLAGFTIGALESSRVQSIGIALFCVALMVAWLQIHVILLRLFLEKVRVFSSEYAE